MTPSLEPSFITVPDGPYTEREKEFAHAVAMCVIERKVLYKDLTRVEKTQQKLDKKFWQFWK